MILPASQAATLVLLVISLICWGTWANTLKVAGKWRFELYYYDFALGFVLLAVVAAFTGGSLNPKELTFQENFLVTGYRNMVYALAAGIVFNLGNMLLAATLSVAGMAMAFGVTFAIALTVSTAWTLIFESSGSSLLALLGTMFLLAAVGLAAYAYSQYLYSRAVAAKQAALQADPRAKSAKRPSGGPGTALPITLGVVGGIAFGLFRPLLVAAGAGANGVAPYGMTLLFSAGIFGCTILLAPFFLVFPVTGAPIKLGDYLRGTAKQHLLGLLGGSVAGIAFLTSIVAQAAPPVVQTAAMPNYALSQGGPILAVICGLFAWREFKGAGERNRLLFLFMLILLAVGLALQAIARR